MSDARARIFGAIRQAAWGEKPDAASIAAEAAALVADPGGVQPTITGDLVQRFIDKATSERVTATVSEVAEMDDVPAAVAAYLAGQGQDGAIAVQPVATLTTLDWGREVLDALPVDGGVAVSLAEYGIAETGSVVFRSGADAPILMNFLPLVHVVVVARKRVLPHLEDLWPHLGGKDAPQARLLTIVTGTSGTADIEAKNIRGAHGPKHMHIVLVG